MFFIDEQSLNEGYLFDSKTIKYQVKEFEEGTIPTLFITGHSGSGKSTLGHKYEAELGIPCYELDDIALTNHHFTDAQLREYGKEAYDYFRGPGKKYRMYPDPNDPKKILGEPDWDMVEASAAFIKYILSRKARCIVEGIEIFQAIDEHYISVDDLKDSAVIIKGTSATKSTIRGMRRDYLNDKAENPDLKLKDAIPFAYVVARFKYMLKDEKSLRDLRRKYRK